ncbi:hypothetical protein KUTeg_018693 [Tegillarca granosa]|uniref:PHD-type domain-containing protein n=1 Tax=Tegillarca granosa TaxID=220873 RepID=A0ABQ9EF15_TEGGR|nr:hypothetical protein KUTeg_018693 [Tegillarca granosa]
MLGNHSTGGGAAVGGGARVHGRKKLFCVCRRPDDGKFMIRCDKCKEWFHGSCVGVTSEEGAEIDEYICKDCQSSVVGDVSGGSSVVLRSRDSSEHPGGLRRKDESIDTVAAVLDENEIKLHKLWNKEQGAHYFIARVYAFNVSEEDIFSLKAILGRQISSFMKSMCNQHREQKVVKCKMNCPEHSKQLDGCICGVYTLMFAEKHPQGVQCTNITTENLQQERKKIAVTLLQYSDILHDKLGRGLCLVGLVVDSGAFSKAGTIPVLVIFYNNNSSDKVNT